MSSKKLEEKLMSMMKRFIVTSRDKKLAFYSRFVAGGYRNKSVLVNTGPERVLSRFHVHCSVLLRTCGVINEQRK